MPIKNINKAWEFNCTLKNGVELKSWFYADTEHDAKNRITNYMEAKLKSIKEIDDPLDISKNQIEKDKIHQTLVKKREKEREQNKTLKIWEKSKPTREGIRRKLTQTDVEPSAIAINSASVELFATNFCLQDFDTIPPLPNVATNPL